MNIVSDKFGNRYSAKQVEHSRILKKCFLIINRAITVATIFVRTKRLSIHSAILLLPLFVAFPCYSAEKNQLDLDKTYKVGIEHIDLYPFFSENTAQDKGFIIELMTLFSAKENINLAFLYLPVTRFADWYDADGIDFRIPDNPAWHPDNSELLYSNEFVEIKTGAVVIKKNEHLKLSEFESIGTLYGFTPSEQWQKLKDDNRITIAFDRSVSILVRALKADFVQGLDLNLVVARHTAKKLGFDPNEFVISKNAPINSFSYKMSTKSYPKVVGKFNTFLKIHDIEVKALIDKYGLSPSAQME